MAKLYFKYGAMGSSKTAQALITKYNYEENDLKVWLIKPSADTRDGAEILRSRIGLEAEVEVIAPEVDIYARFLGGKARRSDVIIVDEAQHAAGSPTKVTQFYKVISSLSARYKIGLTATPKRADGLQAAMFALLGGKIHEVTREEVAHTTCPVKVEVMQTGWMPDYDAVLMGDGMIDYSKIIDAMIHDENRFNKVMDIINEIPHACPTMVLANRVEYLQDMLTNYEKTGICISGQGQSKKAKAERKEALEKLNNGEIDCIFCTYSLAAEGLDVPNLRYVVFATPEKNDVTVTQATGRVSRKAEGKEYGTVIDFVDDFGMYKGFYKERLKVYKKLNCDIIE